METGKACITACSATQEGGEVNTPNDHDGGMWATQCNKRALAAPAHILHDSSAVIEHDENDKLDTNTAAAGVLSRRGHGERHARSRNHISRTSAAVVMSADAARHASALADDALPPYLRHRSTPAMLLANLKLPTRADATRLNQVVRARIATLRAEIAVLHTLMRKTDAQQQQQALQQQPRSIFSMLYETLIEMPLHVLLQLGSQCWYICRHLWQQWRGASSILYLWHTTCNPLELA